MPAPAVPPSSSEEVVYRLVQSPGIHLLGMALGLSIALLLAALRLPWAALSAALLSLAYATVALHARTQVLVTHRRLFVRRALGEETMRLAEVRDVRLETDLWSEDLVVTDASGRAMRVRDLRDPAGAVAVLGSLARAARAPEGHALVGPEALLGAGGPEAFLPPASAAERAALDAKLAHKRAVRPVDLGFLDERRRAAR